MLDRQQLKYTLQRFRAFRVLSLAVSRLRARTTGLPHWKALLREPLADRPRADIQNAGERQDVLIATGAGGHLPSATLESLLGTALSRRGAGVSFLLCDGCLPACMMCEINWYQDLERFAREGPRDRCKTCHEPAAGMLAGLALPTLGLSRFLSPADREDAISRSRDIAFGDIPRYEECGISVGEHAMAGALRFFARGSLEADVRSEAVVRRYFAAALLTARAAVKLFGENRYSVVVLNHGIYVPQGIFVDAARASGVRVVTWHPAYRKQCFIFNHGETYHHGLMTEPTSRWEDAAWNDDLRDRTLAYLASRWHGASDWIRFHRDPVTDMPSILKATGIDLSRPVVGLLTNVVWDAQLHYPANAFPDMLTWLFDTVEWFADHPELQLVIRIHPAEVTGTIPSRQPVADELRKQFGVLPPNIVLVLPESRLSTYALMSLCNAVLIYGTKTGVELAATGIPVVVAGEAWVRGKGITRDASSREEYLRILNALPFERRLPDDEIDRARRYAFHFFFRRMIPVRAVTATRGWPPYRVSVSDITELDRGACAGLDVICDGILDGSPFEYPAELDAASQ